MLIQASELRISSGYSGLDLITIDMIQNCSYNSSVPRQDINILGNSKPLNERNIINYVPVKYNIEAVKCTNDIENHFGLMNPSGVAVYYGSSSEIVGYGVRDLNSYLIDKDNGLYKGQLTLKSGVLQSYNLSASVGDIAKISIGGEGLDIVTSGYNSQILNTNSNINIVKTEDISISGIQLSGFGITGVSIQSFSIGLSFNRTSTTKIGYRYPERKLSNSNGSISINGFLEGVNSNNDIFRLNNGTPETGTLYFTLIPTCSSYPSTTYIVKNPYIEDLSIGASVGSFTSIGLEFSIPLPHSSHELLTGSNIIIV